MFAKSVPAYSKLPARSVEVGNGVPKGKPGIINSALTNDQNCKLFGSLQSYSTLYTSPSSDIFQIIALSKLLQFGSFTS